MNENTDEDYIVNVVNISYDRKQKPRVREIPDCIPLTIPDGILNLRDKKEKFLEEIEYFVYNSLSRKFGVDVCFCQIFLPMD